MCDFGGLLIRIDVPKSYFDAQTIILLIKQLLALPVLLCASRNYVK